MTHAEKGLLLDLPPKRLTFWLVEDKIKQWCLNQVESNSVCNHTSDWQNRTVAKRDPDLLITSMIMDRIERQ